MQPSVTIHRPQAAHTSGRMRRLGHLVCNVLLALVPLLLLASLANFFVVEAALVKEGPSMQPTLYRGYRVVLDKVSYRFHPPHRGDVVIVAPPGEPKLLIKRVVAVPGDTVEVRDGHVYIDGRAINEPWVTYFGGSSYPSTRVPRGQVFVLGDNRSHSRDSRVFGPVPLDALRGQARLIIWPLNHAGRVE
jgi:signal peptidase I